MINISSKNGAGFTLIEALIAVLILGIGLSGAFTALVMNSNTADLVKNGFVASGLAQEGIEVIRSSRDGDWFVNRAFGSFGGSAVAPDGVDAYQIEWNSDSISANQNVFLKRDATGTFNYLIGSDTLFKRTISIITPITSPANVEKIVTVKVFWSQRGINRNVTAEVHLFDWGK